MRRAWTAGETAAEVAVAKLPSGPGDFVGGFQGGFVLSFAAKATAILPF